LENVVLLNLANTAPLLHKKNVVTIHDLAVWDFPESYSSSFKAFYKFIIPRIIKSAKKVVTVSNFSRSRIKERFGVDADVVYNAVSDQFYYNPTSKKNKTILAVSSLDPKKNFRRLLQAFQLTKLPDYKLVLVGGKNSLF